MGTFYNHCNVISKRNAHTVDNNMFKNESIKLFSSLKYCEVIMYFECLVTDKWLLLVSHVTSNSNQESKGWIGPMVVILSICWFIWTQGVFRLIRAKISNYCNEPKLRCAKCHTWRSGLPAILQRALSALLHFTSCHSRLFSPILDRTAQSSSPLFFGSPAYQFL